MALRKIAVMGHPVLRQIAQPIPIAKIKTQQTQELIRDMVESMYEYDGRGLAAPQIHESLQLVVMLWDFNPKETAKIQVLINPKIQVLTDDIDSCWEGCLSLPGLRGKVDRPNKILLEAFDQEACRIEKEVSGFAATVIQHECDHLLGKLYVDRMTDFSQLAFSKEYSRFHDKSEDEE